MSSFSPSIPIVMQLAVQEAEAGRYKDIQPEHLCMALLKFTEVRDVRDPIMAEDLRLLIGELAKLGVESTPTRRKLREALGKGGEREWSGQPLNSPTTEAIFKSAREGAAGAKSSTVTAVALFIELMKSPSNVIARVVLNQQDPRDVAPTKEIGLPRPPDHQQPVKGLLGKSAAFETETKAVASILSQSNRKSILLISDEIGVMDGIFMSLAVIFADRERPAALKGRRLVDIRGNHANLDPEKLVDLRIDLTEALTKPEAILVVPQLKMGALGMKDPWAQLLESQFEKGTLQFITTIPPEDFASHISTNRLWKRHIQPVWFHSELTNTIPDEL